MNPIRGRAALAALVLTALLAGCDGSNNPWREVPTGPTPGGTAGVDSVPPTVTIQSPNAETPTVAVGAEIFVRARIVDPGRIATVTFEGFSVRGDPALGTDQVIERFEKKTVDLTAGGRTVTDTVIDRFLVATADTVPESGVFIVVTARDTADNFAADTFRVTLGGPRVRLSELTPTSPFAGTQLSVRLVAQDARDLLTRVQVTGSGSFTPSIDLRFDQARAAIDTTLVIPIPQGATPGTLSLVATATSGSNQTAQSPAIEAVIQASQVDATAPRVTMSTAIATRVEQTDSFTVSVTATDENRVDSVGITVHAIRQRAGGADTVRVYRGAGAGSPATFRFGFAELAIGNDTATVDLRITAWAKDPAGNCATATTPNTPQQLPCVQGPGAVRVSSGPGALVVVFAARGLTIDRPNGTDVIADLAADSSYLYLSNFTRNRVELMRLGGRAYGQPVRVGAQPWGLALGRTRDSLYVANSGGTNISVVPLGGAVLAEAEDRRISPPNELLFSVEYNPETGEVSTVVLYDYSDRPQFLAQASNGLLVYSTRPTAAASDGTVRIFDPRKPRSDIFIGYVDRSTPGRAIVVNADSAFQVPPSQVRVCPRRRTGDTFDPPCIEGSAQGVSAALTTMRSQPPNAQGARYDTRLDLGADIAEVGFADTTFVAASTDRRFIAVGEGVRENARIPMFEALGDSLVLRGDVRDLISNTAERVIGLGINRDGSLGVARGNDSYFFTSRLRLLGTVASGAPTGGVAMHPGNAGYPGGGQRLSFVSGIEDGRPYIDVIDTFNFFRLKRIFTRDPVVGALVVAPRAPGDAADVNLRLYALTSAGVLGLSVTNADLQP
ncbi:MAG: YncE family protein [Egibacteraceae bacterium]